MPLHQPLRVVVTGSESTGKTTLAAELAAHYGTVWSPEFAREYLDRKGSALDDSDVEPIARGQVAGEDEAALRAGRLLVLDTDLVSTVVYARYYYGRCPEWIAELARKRVAQRYLLLCPDVPWVPDGAQRDRPAALLEVEYLTGASALLGRQVRSSLEYGWPSAAGATDRPMNPASTTIVTM